MAMVMAMVMVIGNELETRRLETTQCTRYTTF